MSSRSRVLARALSTAASSAVLLVAAPALANAEPDEATSAQPQATARPPAPEDDGVQVITVTAQRREENLQNVPITVNAVTAETALNSGATSTADLSTLVSGVTTNRVTGSPIIFIRGVGSQNSQTGEEGTNPIYLDGFLNPALPSGIFAFNSIERVEVLKGPQGTLFGRNSVGGAINVVTRDPSSTPSADLSVGYSNYNTLDTNFYGTTGLGEGVAADLSLVYHNQMTGYGINRFNGQDVNQREEFAGRVKFLVTPTANTRIELAADYDRSNANLGFSIHIAPGAFAGGSLQTYPGNYYDVNQNDQPVGYVRQWGLTARISHDFPWARAVSMTGYRDVFRNFTYDVDLTVNPVFKAVFPSTTTGFTQEFQLLSNSHSRIQWIVGAFYLNSGAHQIQTGTGTALGAVGGTQIFDATIDTDSIAGYAQVTVPLGSRSDITAGVRYTHDHKTLGLTLSLPNRVPPSLQTRADEHSWDAVTWRFAASHHFTDDIMAYASVSRGFKAGAFNPSNFTNPVANPEHMTAYELGLRTELFDRHLRFNASVFRYDYTNIQLLQAVALVGAGSFLVNAASAKVQGMDLEMEARPVHNLTIGAGATILFDHQYGSFPNAPGSRQNAVPPGGNATFFFDASGNTMIQSPDFTGYVNAAYRIPIARGGNVTLSGNYSYNSGYFGEVDNRLRQPAYGLTNAQIAWTLPNEHFTIRLWARNIFDVQYSLYLKSSLVDGVAPAPPRTFGGAVDVHF